MLVYCGCPDRTSFHTGWLFPGCAICCAACCLASSASLALTAGDCADAAQIHSNAAAAASDRATPNVMRMREPP